MQLRMGICNTKKVEKQCHLTQVSNSGDLEHIVAQVKASRDVDEILNESKEHYKIYNPFMNPILSRRLREQQIDTQRLTIE